MLQASYCITFHQDVPSVALFFPEGSSVWESEPHRSSVDGPCTVQWSSEILVKVLYLTGQRSMGSEPQTALKSIGPS